MEYLHSEKKKGILALLVYYILICITLTKGQQSPAYVKEKSSGCVNNSMTTWNIPTDYTLFLTFNTTVYVCIMVGIPGGEPIITIVDEYRGRISCGVDVVQKYTFICFTTTVTVSDAGVYTARLGSEIATDVDNTLFVMRPPTKPVIDLQGNLINQRQHNLTCTAVSTSVPNTGFPLTYTWTVDGATITDPRFVVTGSDNSVLMINRVQKQDNGKRIRCTATEEKGLSSDASDETTLDVMYVPEMSLSPSNRVVILGDNNVQFICTVVDTNPSIQSFRWTKGGNQISTSQTYTITTVQKSDRGTYQCTASNSVGSSQPASVNVDVQFPPSVSPLISQDIIEDEDLSVTCSVTAGNPTSYTVYWTMMNNPEFRQNGTTLRLDSIERHSSGNYTCTAENVHYNGRKGTASQSMDVDVLFTPGVTTSTTSPYRVVEGQSATMTCSVSAANPNTDITWSWIKTDSTSNVIHTGATYTISNIQRGASGSYSCRARNSIGTSTPITVQVDVQYTNVITSNISERYVTSEHGRLEIKCDVDGNPLSTITWLFVQNNTIVKRDIAVGSSSLDISSANCLDHGVYKVTADNGKGPAAVRTTYVAVRCKPRLYNIDPLSPDKLVMRNHDSLQILVRLLLYPPATLVQWIVTGKQNKIIQNNTDGYEIIDTKGEVEQNITLYKSRINTEDFGDYTLVVQNDIGTFFRIYHVDTAQLQESVGNQAGVAVGSAVGIVTLIIIILVLVICLRRRYTITIKFERKSIDKHVKMTDATIDESSIPMTEPNVQRERSLYEEVTERENVNQYEGLSKKDQPESEGMQAYESIQGSNVENKYETLSTVTDKQADNDSISPQSPQTSTLADVYINTSFLK